LFGSEAHHHPIGLHDFVDDIHAHETFGWNKGS
jgi:hypothetical protein